MYQEFWVRLIAAEQLDMTTVYRIIILQYLSLRSSVVYTNDQGPKRAKEILACGYIYHIMHKKKSTMGRDRTCDLLIYRDHA